MPGVALLLIKSVTGVMDSVVFAKVVVGKDTLPVSTWVRDGRGEVVVCSVLGKPGGSGVVVVVALCVLVSV